MRLIFAFSLDGSVGWFAEQKLEAFASLIQSLNNEPLHVIFVLFDFGCNYSGIDLLEE